MEGTPPPSTVTASRSERATPLNVASTTWWVLTPAFFVTWRVMPADVANDCQKCSAISGLNGGSPSGSTSPAADRTDTNTLEFFTVDTATRKLIRRIKLAHPAKNLAVTQDDRPLLFAFGGEGPSQSFVAYDALTGKKLRERKLDAPVAMVTGW